MSGSAKTQASRLRQAKRRIAELEQRITDLEAWMRSAVWIDPERQGGQPCLGGHRLTVSSVMQVLTESEGVALHAYPQLTVEQLKLARWYHDTYWGQDRTCRWPRPVIHVDPARRFGRPMIDGISCEAIAERVGAGEALDDVADDYGLTRPQVLLACWYIGMWGPPEWQEAWLEWVNDNHSHFARSEYGQIPDPPPGPRFCEGCDQYRCGCASEDPSIEDVIVSGGVL